MAKEKNHQEAHKHSIRNREEIESSEMCGCFGCCRTFSPSEVDSWVDLGQTALCPYCDIDAVIGDSSGVVFTPETLKALHNRYF